MLRNWKFVALNLAALLSITTLFGQAIVVTGVSPSPVCAGTNVIVTFSTTNGNGTPSKFTGGTNYTIYLSNSTGSAFTSQGTFTTTGVTYNTGNGGVTTGITKVFTIPAPSTSGTGYKISIGSIGPTFNGSGGAGASAVFTINALPAAAGIITGTANVCQGQNSVSYSVPAIANASGYTWALPAGATIAGGANTRSIAVNYSGSATSGNLTVYGTNTCGNGTPSANYVVAINPLPVAAGTISGTATVCQGQNNIAYSVPAITNATGYTWTLPAGAGIASGTNTNSITVNYSGTATSGNVTVYGTNTCGNGTASATYAVAVNSLPAAAGTISGAATVCQGQNSVVYSVASIANSTGYSWTLPAGATIITGANTNTMTVNYFTTASSGNIKVQGTNACGSGTVSTGYAVTVNPLPAAAGAISGTATVCAGQTNVAYTVPAIANATSYVWTLPTGATIASGTGNSITVDYSTAASSGNINVRGTNTCGNGTASLNYAVNVTSAPDVTGLSVSALGGCTGQSSQITINSSTLINGTYTVTYDLEGANIASGNTAAMVFTAGAGSFSTSGLTTTGVTNIVITQLDLGCSSPLTTNNTASFTVNPISTSPTTIVSSAPSNTICIGGNTVLTISGGTQVAGAVIKWYAGTCGGTFVGTGNGISVSPLVTTTYYGRYEDASPCTSVTACASITIIVNQKSTNPTSATSSAISNTICVGGSTSLTLSGGALGTGGSIEWFTASCGGTSVGTGNGLLVSPLSTTTYYGRYTDPLPCNSVTSCVSITITVNQKSVAPSTAASSAVSNTICNGGTTTLTLSGGALGTAGIIRWYSSSCGGTPVGTGNGVSVSPVNTTTYYGRYEDALPCTSVTSCASVTVFVNQKSTAPTTAVASPASICVGGTSALTLSGGIVSPSGVIRWYTGSCGAVSVGTGNSFNVSPSATTTYYGRYEDAAPCSFNTTCVQVTVTVNSSPTVNAGTPILTCGSSSQRSSSFPLNITAGASASNYSSVMWTSSGTNPITNPNSLINATYSPSTADIAAGSVTLTLTAFGNLPCGNSVSAKTLTITPAITGVTSIVATPVCFGSGYTLDPAGTPGGGNGAFSYLWEGENNCGGGNGWPDLATSPQYVVPSSQLGFCFRSTITSGGCTLSTNKGDLTSLANGATNAINFGSSVPAICVGGSTTLTASSAVSYTYTWSPAAGLSSTSGATVVATPAGTTTYTITGTATSGPACTKTATFTVTVNPLATFNGVSATSVCSGSSSNVVLNNLLANSTSSVNYKIGTGSLQTVNGIVSNGGGTASFLLPLTTADNGQLLTVTAVSSSINGNPPCTRIFNSGNTTTLAVNTPPSISLQPLTSGICIGSTGSIAAGINGSALNITWQVSTNNGNTWTNIPNAAPYSVVTGSTLSTLNISSTAVNMSTNLYRIIVSSGTPCNLSVTSGSISLKFINLWTGTVSSDYNNASNWSDGNLPATLCSNVYIPNKANQPSLNSPLIPVPAINNLIIDLGATLTVANATLKIAGSITNNGLFDITSGSLEFNGSSAQNIAGSSFSSNSISNLTVSNPAGLTISPAPNDSLRITGALAFGAVGGQLYTGDNLVLASTINGTARVAEITNGTISGKVTVERYYPARRAWRLVTSPLSNTGSIFDNWQIGGPGTYVAGKGMFITGPAPTGSAGNGLDYSVQNKYSMQGFSTSNYVGVSNTKTTNLSGNAATAANIGYFAFVRGDRNRFPDNTVASNASTTTLSSKGFLQTGNQTFNVGLLPAGAFALIGNPYASSIDFTKISMVNMNSRKFYVYDPSLGTLGLFVTMEDINGTGTFTQSAPSVTSTQGNFILSSQAFFVEADGSGLPGKVVFNESDKVTYSNPNLFRPATPAGGRQGSLRINLLQLNANSTTLLVDGDLVEFDGRFSENVDIQDALKFTNITENLAIMRNLQPLSVERRPVITANDTIFLRLTKTTQRSYRFEFIPGNLDPLLTAFLEDSYTGTQTPLSTTSNSMFDFVINGNAASAVSNRFRIVFKQIATGPLPVTYTSIKGYQQGTNIAVEWTVENELNIDKYEIEKSIDAVNFTKVNTIIAIAANRTETDYKWLDQNPVNGNNYYRIRSVDADGKYEYTKVVLVEIAQATTGIRVYPNPVTTGIIRVEFKKMPAGIYTARLLNSGGQTMLLKQINHVVGTSMENLKPDYKLAAGIYQLEIIAPSKDVTNVKVIVK